MSADFWSRTVKDGCWLWSEGKTTGGYGEFYTDGRTVYAHRHAWELANGPIPAGQFVLHRCDVRSCVNPDHLFLGSHADNMRDCAAKGRFNRALNADIVRQIRQRRDAGESFRGIAKSIGTTHATVIKAYRGVTWGSVDA